MRWATLVVNATRGQDPHSLDTLAAAYAESGEFEKAISVSEKIIELAQAADKPEIADAARERLKLYQAQKPYRDREQLEP